MMNNLQGRLAGLKSSSSASFSKNNQNQLAPFDDPLAALDITSKVDGAHLRPLLVGHMPISFVATDKRCLQTGFQSFTFDWFKRRKFKAGKINSKAIQD